MNNYQKLRPLLKQQTKQIRKYQFLMLCLLLFIQTLNAEIKLADLDFSKLIEDNDMYFVPLKDNQYRSGVIWYKTYLQKSIVSKPNRNDMCNVTIYLIPQAHSSNKYNDFIIKHDIDDLRKNLFGEQDLKCEASEELKKYLSNYSQGPLTYKPNIRIGGYPQLCSLSFRIHISWLEDIQEMINNLKIWNLNGQIPLLSNQQRSIDIYEIFRNLMNNKLLEQNNNIYEGKLLNVLQASFDIMIEYPRLFGGNANKENWLSFVEIFEFQCNSDNIMLSYKKDNEFPKYSHTKKPIPILIVKNDN